jgi:hypothetical protein
MKKNLLFPALLLSFSCFAQYGKHSAVVPAGKVNINDIRSNKFVLNDPQPAAKSAQKKNEPAVKVETKNNSGNSSAKTMSTSINWKMICGSSNCYGQLVSNTQPLQYNPDVNVVTYFHRNSVSYSATPTVPAGTESGIIVAEVSTDWGATWDSTCIWAGSSSAGRYPQGAVYSAPGNTSVANAFVVGSGITILNGSVFNGDFYASKQLAAPGSTLYNTTSSTVTGAQQLLTNTQATFAANQSKHGWSRYGFTSTSDGIVRSMAFVGNDLDALTGVRGAAIVKGSFAAGVFNWTTDTLIPITVVTSGGDKVLGFDIQQAWNQAGTIGYGVMIGAVPTATRSNRGYQPIVFKTTNSGGSWSQVNGINFNATSMDMVTDHLAGVGTGTNIYSIPYFNTFDLAVDSAGLLHIGALVCSGAIAHDDSLNYIAEYTLSINGPNKKYQWKHTPGNRPYIYDFVGDGTAAWKAILVDSMSTEDPGAVSTSGGYNENPWDANPDKINLDSRLQVGRTPDGKYITYAWSESDTNFTTSALKYNLLPNIKTRLLRASGTPTNYLVSNNEINVSKPAAGQGSVNPLVASRASLHYLSPTTSSATVLAGCISTVDIITPISITNNTSWTQLDNQTTWYTSARLSYAIGSCVGLNEETRSTYPVELYPNPSSANVSLRYEMNEFSKTDIVIYNLVGKAVKSMNVNSEKGSNEVNFDVSDLNSGIYFVNLRSGNIQVTKKLIVE